MLDEILTTMIAGTFFLIIGLVIGYVAGKATIADDCMALEKFRYDGEVYECKLIK